MASPNATLQPRMAASTITTEDHRGRTSVHSVSATIPPAIADAQIDLPGEVHNILTEAVAAVTALDVDHGEHLLPVASILLKVESLSSSRIEGLDVSHRRLFEALWDFPGTSTVATQVASNVRAMHEALRVALGPLTPQAILAIHRTLFDSAGRMAPWAGTWREAQNRIGPANPARADYVPPPPGFVEPLMVDLCRFAARSDITPIAHVAVLHAQFEGVHPFVDGNGRVGRCLLHGLLRHRGTTARISPPISMSLLDDRPAYYAALRAYQQHGDPTPICRLTAEATIDACTRARRLDRVIHELRGDWVQRLAGTRSDSGALALLPHLIERPVVTMPAVSEILGVSTTAAARIIERLETATVLTQQSAGRRNRVWAARDLYRVLDEHL